MKKELRTYPVNEEVMDYLQFLHFDILSYEHIIKNILLTHKDNLDYVYNKEIFDHFMELYKECMRKYEITKKEILLSILDEEDKGTFEFDFNYYCIREVNEEGEDNDGGCSLCH